MSENRAISETYVTDPEPAPDWRIDERDERAVLERTDLEQEAFRAKLQAFRNGGMPAYHGPRAAR